MIHTTSLTISKVKKTSNLLDFMVMKPSAVQIVNTERSINENRLTEIRRKTFSITPECVDFAPELLTFDNEVYRTFIKTGIVFGDVIKYETTFGIKLKTTGNTRTLKQFLGFKRVHLDKTVDYLTATYQVNGGSVNKSKT